jgi:hypothetical protein
MAPFSSMTQPILSSKREWRLFFVALATAFLFAGGIGEIYLRIQYGSKAFPKSVQDTLPPHLVSPDETMGYTLTPGFVGKTVVPGYGDVEDRINHAGLRDYEREFPPSAELVFAIGDSMTYGYGVRFDQIWPTLLENKIRAVAPQYYVIKGGVPGFSWRQYYQQYQRLTKGVNRHPLVIVGFNVDAGNRLYQGFEPRGGVIVKRFYPNLVVLDGYVYEKQSRSDFVNQVDKFLRTHFYFFRWFNQSIFFIYHRSKKSISQAWGKNKKQDSSLSAEPHPSVSPSERKALLEESAVYDTSIPIPERKHIKDGLAILDSIFEIAKKNQAKMLVLLIARPDQLQDEIAYYKKVLSEKGIYCLDLSQFEDTARWRFHREGHWNAYGSEQVAEKAYAFMRENRLLDL